VRFLEQRAVPFTTVEGWRKLDAHEIASGRERGRDRIKVVDRDEMTRISRA
jgi:ferredoxin--NADP+ reductase